MALISDINVAILADHGVNQADLAVTREKLEKAGVHVFVISSRPVEVKAWAGNEWGNRIKIDRKLSKVSPDDFHGLLIPGGPLHADELRMNSEATNLVKQFFSAGKKVASIGHGIQVLIDADILGGRLVTGPHSLKIDVENAGGIWEEREIMSDNGLITCRGEGDVEKFSLAFLDELRNEVSQRTETII